MTNESEDPAGEDHTSFLYWFSKYRDVSKGSEWRRCRGLVDLANAALSSGVGLWSRIWLRKTVCLLIRRHPESVAGMLFTFGADSSRDITWNGLISDPAILEELKDNLDPFYYGKLLSLERQAAERKRQRSGGK